MERNIFGLDNSLGMTTIDLENRWYSRQWSGQGIKPLEHRTVRTLRASAAVSRHQLRLPTSKLPQGKLRLWVDIFSDREAGLEKNKMWDITPPPPAPFEMRAVIWKARNMKIMDSVTKQNDLYVVCEMEGMNMEPQRQESDTHWRAKDGNGSFNYRMKFNFMLPLRKPRFKVQAWDQDILTSNDAIGEVTMSLNTFLRRGKGTRPMNSANASALKLHRAGKRGTQAIYRFPRYDKSKPENVHWVQLFSREKDAKGRHVPQGEISMEWQIMPQYLADQRPGA